MSGAGLWVVVTVSNMRGGYRVTMLSAIPNPASAVLSRLRVTPSPPAEGGGGPGRGGFIMGIAPLSGSLPLVPRGERDKLFVASNRLFSLGQGHKVHSPIQLFRRARRKLRLFVAAVVSSWIPLPVMFVTARNGVQAGRA